MAPQLRAADESSRRRLRRIGYKFCAVVLTAALLVLLLESIVFHAAGRMGWEVSGPGPAMPSHHVREWTERFGIAPSSGDGTVAAPIMPQDSRSWYRIDEAAPPARVDGTDGLIAYQLGRGPRVPVLPPFPYLLRAVSYQPGVLPRMATGIALISSEGAIWCRIDVAMPFRFRLREYVGRADEFAQSPMRGWRTSRFHVLMFAHNVALVTFLFGWPFFVGDGRAALRRLREGRRERANRLPRPVTVRGIALRSAAMVAGAIVIASAFDSIIFSIATHDGPQLVASATTGEDEAWWRRRVGEIPAATPEPFNPPQAIGARGGTWLIPRGGHGGPGTPGAPGLPSLPVPMSLIAYSVQEQTPRLARWSLLRGRALASSDGRSAYRMGSPLPFVARERWYVGSADEFAPALSDDRWNVRFRPLGFLGNFFLLFVILGWPIYLRDGRALARMARGRCTSCGYLLRGLPTPRCPECGCAPAGVTPPDADEKTPT